MIHRDLKPSNVMVSEDRVVVLDFGLVLELDRSEARVTHEGMVTGTPAYMAPEQALAAELDERVDWYAFGVMLFEAIAGVLPIEGRSATELLVRKTTDDAPPLETLAAGVPYRLARLCNALLQREPGRRPKGATIIDTLDGLLIDPTTVTAQVSNDPTSPMTTHRPGLNAPQLVGRDVEMEQLSAALEAACNGAAQTIHVRGASGGGKSVLVERFLADIADSRGVMAAEPLVLRSRCDEREAMPYKALDGLIEGVVQHLAKLHDAELGHLLPREIGELSRIFPELERVDGVRRLVEKKSVRGDRLQVRVRGEAALRALLGELALRQPLVIWIDDLQWGDLDSANILKNWQEHLRSTALLFVFSFRSEEVETSLCLREMLKPSGRPEQAPAKVIDLASLDTSQVEALCIGRLGAVARKHPEIVAKITLESNGNPFLASQLAALVQARIARGDASLESLTIEQLVGESTTLVGPDAARILNVLAVAGRPMLPKLAFQAAAIESNMRAHLHALRALRLIRARDVGTVQLIEPYHDRVREAVVQSLGSLERAQIQAALLDALEQTPGLDAGWLFALALEAAQPDRALRHGLAAAEHAEAVFAFEQAAELLQRCIALREQASKPTTDLLPRLADCLGRAGRGVLAAEAYLEAARSAEPSRALVLQRIAASHLLRCGEYERGNRIVHDVVRAHGFNIPETDVGLLAAIAWERTLLAVRGLSFDSRSNAVASEEDRVNGTLFGTLTIEYQAYDALHVVLFQSYGLRLSLSVGDRHGIARMLCVTAIVTSVTGSQRAKREAEELLNRAETIADELKNADLYAELNAAKAVALYMLGRIEEMLEPSYEAERSFRSTPGREDDGVYYHRMVVVTVRVGALFLLGDYKRAVPELARLRDEARATGNRNTILQLALVQTFAEGLRGEHQSSKTRLVEERSLLPSNRFGPNHVLHMAALTRAASALQDFTWAADWLEADWRAWTRSLMRRSAFLSLMAVGSRLRFLVNRHVVEQ